MFYTASSGSAWTSRLDLSATPGSRLSKDNYNFSGVEKVVIVDGVNKPIFWSSATGNITQDTAAPADVQGATEVAVYKGHLFFAKGPLLSFTAPYADTDYASGNGAGVINVGTEILSLIVFRQDLIIFGKDSILRITGNTSTDFQVLPITSKTGVVARDTVQEVGGDILYLGPDGIRYLSASERIGDFALERASEKIQPTLLSQISGSGTFASVVVRSKSQYRLFSYIVSEAPLEAKGFLGTRFVDRTSNVDWGLSKGIKVKSGDSRQFLEGERIIFNFNTDYVYKMESGGSFDGENIFARYLSPDMPITDPRVRKTIYHLTLYINTDGQLDADVGLKFDAQQSKIIQPKAMKLTSDGTRFFYGDLGATYGTATYGGVASVSQQRNTVGSGFTVAVEIIDDSTNPSFRITSILLEYQQNDRK